MLKEVGASGQISLGKKYAGQLFDVVFYPDGRVELVPMKAVPAMQTEPPAATAGHRVQEEAPPYRLGDGWLTPERLALRRAAGEFSPVQAAGAQPSESTADWANTHASEIDQYNAWASQREPYSQRVRRWRENAAPPTEAGKS